MDTSEYDGLQGTCAGSESPWGTHLGSEENYPNGAPFVRLNGGIKCALFALHRTIELQLATAVPVLWVATASAGAAG